MKIKLSYLIVTIMISMSALAQNNIAAEGNMAPDFEITKMDGSKFKLSDYQGKKTVYLVFWNTWCGYCMKKIPKLKEIQTDLSDQIKIIAINTSLKDSVEKSVQFQQQFEINYSLAFDHGEKITDRYSVWGTPTEFIIDINGIIQHRDGVPANLQPLLAQWNTVNDTCSDTVSVC